MIDKAAERKAGMSLSYVNTILQAVLGFVYVPLLLKYMGTSQYGLYQLMGSMIAYFSIMDFGLSTAVIRFYVSYKQQSVDELQRFLDTMQKLYIGISLLAGLIGSIIYFFLDDLFAQGLTANELYDAKKIYILLLINIIISLSGMLYRAIITANESFLFLKGIETIQFIFQPILVIAILQIWPTAFAMASVMTLLNGILTFFRWYYTQFKLEVNITVFNKTFEKLMLFKIHGLVFSTFIVSIVDQIFLKSNQVILGMISGTYAVAVYSIAALIYTSYLSFSYAVSGVFLPKVTSLVVKDASSDVLSDLFIKLGKVQYFIYVLILSGFILFGKEFVILWAGAEYIDAWIIALVIMLPYTIDMIQNLGLAILQAKNIYGIRAKVYCVSGALSVILAFVLGWSYGGIGCAIGTAVSLFLGSGIAMNYCYAHFVQLNILKFWKEIGRVSISIAISFVAGILLNQIVGYKGIMFLFIKILVYTGIYCASGYLFLLNKNEKNKIRKFHRGV